MYDEPVSAPDRVPNRRVSSQSTSQPSQPFNVDACAPATTAAPESSPRTGRGRTRHGSLRQLHQAAANALSRRLSSARFSLTRQKSVTSADGAGAGEIPGADAGSSSTVSPTAQASTLNDEAGLPVSFSLGGRRRLSRSPQHQLSGPSGASKFQLLAPMSPTSKLQASLVHQRSNESHESTTSGVSMMSVHSSAHSERDFKMDLMNFKKQDSFGCEEGGGPDYGYCIGAGAIGGSGAGGSGGPGGPAGCGGAGGGVGGGGACGGGGSVGDKQGDASIKGLWRRAFNILKTKDKDKEKAKKKRGGKEDEDGADVDPVYSLLKRAADKGVQKCSGCTGPMTGTSPRASDASLFSASPGLSGLRRESLMSKMSGSPVSSWARRKATMNAFRMKSISVDHGPPLTTATAAATASAAIAAIAAASAAATAATTASKEDKVDNDKMTSPMQLTTVALVTAPADETGSLSETTATLEATQQVQCELSEHSQTTSAATDPTTGSSKTNKTARPMLDSRKKSVSVDNPDQAASGAAASSVVGSSSSGGISAKTLLRLDDDAKRKSSSFTNTNCIESQGPPNPHRRKQLAFGRNKSFSMEQENITGTRRHVELSNDSLYTRRRDSEASSRHSSILGSPRRGGGSSGSSPGRHGGSGGIGAAAGESSPHRSQEMTRQLGKKRLQWKMKSFSLDAPDVKQDIGEGETVPNDDSLGVGADRSVADEHPRSASTSAEERRFTEGDFQDTEDLSRYEATGYTAPPADSEKIMPQRNRKLLRDSRLSGNLFVVLYDFKARHRDEMDLRAGFKLSCTEMSDPDWWRGKCMGRVGLFPSAYVQRIREGDVIWRVLCPQTVPTDCGGSVKLYRGQIVVQQRPRVSQHSVPIRLKDGRELDCSVRTVERLFD